MKINVYLASGWFNSEQKKQMNEVYKVLKSLKDEGKIGLFAPFYDGVVLKKDDPDLRRKMKEVWQLDIDNVKSSELIVACTIDHDVGTIFECGYASAINGTILCYNSKPEHGLNLMLAQEARGFVKNPKDLKAAVESFREAYIAGDEAKWIWNVWKGEPI